MYECNKRLGKRSRVIPIDRNLSNEVLLSSMVCQNSAAICMDAEVNTEMRRAYGFAMTYPAGVSR
jgi:hypothetical protein